MSNANNNVLYTGVTNDLSRRVEEHKQGMNDGFTKKYNVKKLVYAEKYDDIQTAIIREKQIKSWSRAKKNELVETVNKEWIEIAPF